ncbi:phage tail tape measure protein [Anaerococcus sp. Marseille-P3915]|uniref:phage tail tape measure protein n=1 Tax=Anaerococcus sp. Marseille-P3915 TaxID=2057799 RepID=UPI000D0BC6C4|nr:phage tail tape measure protein [Anaerococcus sp. Marseille-P3915]
MASDGKLLFDTKLDTSGFKSGLASLSSMATAAGKGFKSITNKAVDGIKTSFKAAGLAAAGFGAYSVKAGAEFDAAMSEVEAISGASGNELDALRNKAKEMGATTKFSATQSAEALKYMGMAGWKSQEMLDGLPGIINLAAASGEDLGLVSDIVTDSLTAFGLQAKDTGRFVDVLAATSTASNTNVSMLGESFKYVAPVAGALGYKVEDVSVALGLMANAGIKSSQAGTSLKTALSRLSAPTKQVAAEMENLGISITDSNGQIKPFNKLMGEMRQSFKGLSEDQKVQAATTLFGKEAMAGMLAIINSSDADFEKLTNSINNSTGAAKEMARVMNDNLKGDITILQSALEGLGISLFENVDTPFRDVVQSVTKQVDRLNAVVTRDISYLPQAIGDMIAEGAVAIAEKAPKFIEAGKTIILSLLDGLQNNSDSLASSATEIITSLVTAFMEVGARLFEVGGEILIKLAEGLTAKAPILVPKAIEIIGKLAESFNKNAPKLIKVGIDLIKAIAKGIAENPDVVAKAVPQILKALAIAFAAFKGASIAKSMMGSLAKGIMGEKTLVSESANGVINSLIQAFNSKGLKLNDTGGKLVDLLAKGVSSKASILKSAGSKTIGPLMTGIKTGSSKLAGIGSNIVGVLSSGISKVGGSKLLTVGGGLIKAIGGGLMKGLTLIGGIGAKIITVLGTVLSNPVGLAVAGAALIGFIIKGFNLDLPKIANSAGKIVGSIANKIKQGASKLIDAGKSMVNKIGEGINATKKFFAEVQSKGLISVLQSKLKAGVNKLKDIGKGFIDGIKEGWDSNEKKVADKAKKLPDQVNKSVNSSDTEPTGENMVMGVVEGLKSGSTDIATAYKDLIQGGVSDSDARAIIRQEGKASVEEYAQAVYEGSGNVRSAYTALRTSGLETMEAAEQFFEIAGLNLNGFVNGVEEGGQTYREKLKEMMDSGMSEIEAVEKLTEIALRNMQGFKDGTSEGAEGIIEEFTTMMKMGLDEVEAFDEMYAKGQINVDAFGQGSAAGKEAALAIYRQLRDSGLSSVEAVQAMHEMGLLNVNGFADGANAGKINVEAAYQALKALGLSEANIAEILKRIGAENVGAFGEGVSSGQGSVAEAYNNTFANPLEARSSLIFDTANQQGHDTGSKFAGGIESSTMEVTSKSQALGQSAIEKLQGGEGEATQKGQELGEQYASGIDASKSVVDASATNIGKDVAQSLSNQASDFNQAGKTAMEGYSSAISSESSKVVASIDKMGSSIQTSLTNTSNVVAQNATKMMNTLASNVTSGSSKVQTSFTNMQNKINSTITSMSSKTISQTKSMMDNVTNTITTGTNKINTQFTQMGSKINTTINNTSNQVKNAADSMMNGFVAKVTNGSNKAKSTVKSTCSQMVSTVNGYKGSFANAGYNLMAGLANGIYNGRSGVINASINVMRSAVNAAKRAAGIHSPSRVFRDEVGKMLTRGMGIGIEDEKGFVVDKVKATMEAIRNKAKNAVLFDNKRMGADLAYNLAGGSIQNKQQVDVQVTNGAVTSVINLDSREIGKAVTPIVSQEISKERRRRG